MNSLPIIQPDTIYVVETETKQYLGRIEDYNEYIVVKSGIVGRPSVIAYEDIETISVAEKHPNVEVLIEDEKLMDLLFEVEKPLMTRVFGLRPWYVDK